MSAGARFALAAACLLAQPAAWASTVSLRELAVDGPGALPSAGVEIPRSDLWIERRERGPESEAGASRLEAMVSSWRPSDLRLDSRVGGATRFEGTGIPEVGLSFVSAPLARWRRVSFGWTAGASFLRLRREASARVYGSPAIVDQSLFLVPLRAGVEATTPFPRRLSAYVVAGWAPTVGVSERSALDDGRAVFGAPLEAGVGLAGDLGGLATRLRGWQARLGVVGTAAAWGDADLTGWGVRGSLGF